MQEILEKKEKINFEDKIKKAKDLLERLTKSDITLNDSLKFYNDGLKELEEAQKLLESAKLVFSTQNKN